MKKRMIMSMRMSESQGEEDEGEHELQHEYERRIRVAPMAANQLAACLCVCEPVLQVIAHDAVLLWPDGPKRASRSTKKHSAPAAQRDMYTKCCFACSTSCVGKVRRVPRDNLIRRADSHPAHARPKCAGCCGFS
jgi:hypothetical protein